MDLCQDGYGGGGGVCEGREGERGREAKEEWEGVVVVVVLTMYVTSESVPTPQRTHLIMGPDASEQVRGVCAPRSPP